MTILSSSSRLLWRRSRPAVAGKAEHVQMSGAKEITGKIKSIENTRKVTSALEMVSASKIRKSQTLMKATRPYARMMRRIVGHLGKANPEYRHPFTLVHA